MTDDEALQIGRKAIEDARNRVGGSKNLVIKELEARTDEDPHVREAYAKVGILLLDCMIRAAREAKH